MNAKIGALHPNNQEPRWPATSLAGNAAWMLAALVLLLHPAPVRALQGDEKQPMQIEADQVELDEAKDTSVYVGNVQVTQGSMHLTADHVTVYHYANRHIKYIIALGQPATYKQLLDGDQGEMQAFAKRMDYDAEKDELVLTQDALLIQGKDRLSSERIVYDRARERMQAGGSGRVQITITPAEENKPGGQPGPTEAPKAPAEGAPQGPRKGERAP